MEMVLFPSIRPISELMQDQTIYMIYMKSRSYGGCACTISSSCIGKIQPQVLQNMLCVECQSNHHILDRHLNLIILKLGLNRSYWIFLYCLFQNQ